MAYLKVFREGGLLRRKWRWHRKSANGRTIATSGQGFTTRWSAKRSAKREYPNDELK
jgi:uncharacterized protein YegP (UPF0339 family)